jgi:non-homologous end joining protein Ku
MPWPREWCLRIAELVSRGKEQLVLIVGIAKAWCFTRCITLIMCETEASSQGRKGELSKQEPELGVALIDQLAAEEFNPENYKDEYRIQVWQCWIKEVKARRSLWQRRRLSAAGRVNTRPATGTIVPSSLSLQRER